MLEGLAGDNTVDVELVSNGTALQAFYRSLAQKIKLAGTEAQVTDTINSEFTLQTTAFGAPDAETRTNPTIEVTSYDLYTKATTTDSKLIGTRTGKSTPLETVTFNTDGTAAYSDQIDGGTTNIMSTVNGVTTIAAKYFTYTKDAASGVEKFVWNIGDITDDEVALSYYAYLTGTMEGTREKGEVYYTNEGATLEYVDINGKYAKKDFPKPAVAWGGATTSFEYYLVNANGEPVNRAGQVIPFANRIVIYGDSKALNLNQDITIPAQTIEASDYLPEDYFLYDVNACYTVSTASDSSLNKGITVSKPSKDAYKTTGTSPEVTQTGAQTTIVVYPQNPTAEETYIQTRVAFGVRWDLTPSYAEYELVKDQIVLDYGKAIQADVLANDTTIPEGYTGTLVGFTAYNANANLKQMQLSAGSETYTTDNGTYTIVDGKVNFRLSTMLSEVEKVFCVVQVTETADTNNYYYLYEELDIIPATSVYYETDFAEDVFTLEPTRTTEGTASKEVQNDGTIGVNQTYGYDSTYTDDTSYSNGSSYRINGDKATDKGDCTTKASFTFTGTGFDLISRTGEEDGQIRVTISNASGTVKTVKVLNKSETELTLYQIPVVSVNDLAYGTYNVLIEVYKGTTYTGNLASLSRGNLFYFDAVRIYDPLDASKAASAASDAGIAYAAYTADGEADATVTEIRSKILDQKTYDGGSGVVDNTVVFVDRTYETDENGAVKATGVEVADYETIGPNNEVYLAKGQGIAFQLTSTATPASIDIGAKSANGAPVTLNASLYSKDNNYSTSISEVINSCTAQNYNLMADAAEDGVTTETILSGGGAYVVIFNDGNGVLSLTDLKVAYGNTSGVATLAGTPEAVEAAGKAMSDDTSAEEQPEEQPNYDILSASFDSETCKLRKYATMTVITTADVVELKVVDYKNREVSADITSTTENNRTTWKLSIQMTNAGTRSYTVTGYGADTTAGASASAEITVTRK